MTMDIIRAFHDRKLLGYGVQDFSSFKNWEVCQRAIYGLPLISDEQREIYTRYTHRTDFDAPQACKEAVLVNGRRSGKSFMMAVSAVHGALFKFGGKKPFLRRGEKLTIKVLAQDREAARTVMRYIEGLLAAPLLKQKVIKTTAHAFEFADDVIMKWGPPTIAAFAHTRSAWQFAMRLASGLPTMEQTRQKPSSRHSAPP